MSGGIIIRNLSGINKNTIVHRTDKYINDPYKDNVVLHLPLHENFNDISNYNRSYTITGSPTIDHDNYYRKNGSLKSNLGSINFNNANWLNLNQDFTIEFNFNQYDIGQHGNIVMSKWKQAPNTSDGQFVLSISQNNLILQLSSNGTTSNIFIVPYKFDFNQWYSIAIVRSNNNILFFVDGKLIFKDIITFNIRNSSQPLLLNRLVYTGSYDYRSNVYMSDLRITLGIARYTSMYIP